MAPEPRLPSAIAGLENFSLTGAEEKPDTADYSDAESFFNLPDDKSRGDEDEEDEDDTEDRRRQR